MLWMLLNGSGTNVYFSLQSSKTNPYDCRASVVLIGWWLMATVTMVTYTHLIDVESWCLWSVPNRANASNLCLSECWRCRPWQQSHKPEKKVCAFVILRLCMCITLNRTDELYVDATFVFAWCPFWFSCVPVVARPLWGVWGVNNSYFLGRVILLWFLWGNVDDCPQKRNASLAQKKKVSHKQETKICTWRPTLPRSLSTRNLIGSRFLSTRPQGTRRQLREREGARRNPTRHRKVLWCREREVWEV